MEVAFAKAPNQAILSTDEGAPTAMNDEPSDAASSVGAVELAARLAGRMCHDYISPAGAIVSGLELLDDPTAPEMSEDAMKLIADSARKLLALLKFDRVALGVSTSAETFRTRELFQLTHDLFAHARAELDWRVEPESLDKSAARVLLNLAQVALGALPAGGLAKVEVVIEDGDLVASADARGPRARLRPAVIEGLSGARLSEGLSGQWVQAYYLRSIVDELGGSLTFEATDKRVSVQIRWSPRA